MDVLIRYKRRIAILVLLGMFLFAGGCRQNNPAAKDRPLRELKKGAADVGQSTGKSGMGGGHRYSQPVSSDTALPWEGKPRFEKHLALFGSSGVRPLRMAAFQTTLPDPLPGEEANVALAADRLAGRMLRPGAVFSLNRAVGPYRKENGYRNGPAYSGGRVIQTGGGGVCKIASTLYNVAVLADLPVLERHAHGMPVPYVPAGQDATVADGAKDFRFRNSTPGPLLIWTDTRGNTLLAAVYGVSKPPQVTWRHQVLQRRPFPTLYRVNRALQPGVSKVVVPGAAGLTVRSELFIKYGNGRIEHRVLKTDRYQPLPRVIENNPRPTKKGPTSGKGQEPTGR